MDISTFCTKEKRYVHYTSVCSMISNDMFMLTASVLLYNFGPEKKSCGGTGIRTEDMLLNVQTIYHCTTESDANIISVRQCND